MDRKKQIEDFLREMDTKYEVSNKFKQQIKPMTYGLDHPNVSNEQFSQLLNRIEESYKRHIAITNNKRKSLEGITKISENVTKISQDFQKIDKGTKQIKESLEKLKEDTDRLEQALKDQDEDYETILKHPKGSC